MNLSGQGLEELSTFGDGVVATAVRKLNVSDNKLKRLRLVREASRLTWLKANNNKLGDDALDEDLEGLAMLATVSMSGNRLRKVPTNCLAASSSTLRALVLNENKISAVEPLGHLRVLNSLILSGNRLTSLRAPAVVGLTSLVRLSLSHNKLTSLPDLSGSPQLAELRVNGNELTALPASLSANVALRLVDVGNNKLADWPSIEPLTRCPRLMNLNLRGNPLCSVTGEAPRGRGSALDFASTAEALADAAPVLAGSPEPHSRRNRGDDGMDGDDAGGLGSTWAAPDPSHPNSYGAMMLQLFPGLRVCDGVKRDRELSARRTDPTVLKRFGLKGEPEELVGERGAGRGDDAAEGELALQPLGSSGRGRSSSNSSGVGDDVSPPRRPPAVLRRSGSVVAAEFPAGADSPRHRVHAEAGGSRGKGALDNRSRHRAPAPPPPAVPTGPRSPILEAPSPARRAPAAGSPRRPLVRSSPARPKHREEGRPAQEADDSAGDGDDDAVDLDQLAGGAPATHSARGASSGVVDVVHVPTRGRKKLVVKMRAGKQTAGKSGKATKRGRSEAQDEDSSKRSRAAASATATASGAEAAGESVLDLLRTADPSADVGVGGASAWD